MPSSKTLSASQLVALQAAAQRPDYMILPLPKAILAKGANRQRLLASLLKQSLVTELPSGSPDGSWRIDDAGQHIALKLSKAGMAAMGVVEMAVVPSSGATASSSAVARPGGKLGEVLAAVGANEGATIEQLVGLTGWLPHTTRAALTRLKQRGFPVQLLKAKGRKAYHMIQAGGG